ncbi:MAG TPA: DNA topoisomerase IB [Nocardioides sp.]
MVRLRQVSPEEPGWTRRRAGRGFVLLDASGERLCDEDAERVRALAIPPAWQDVWICSRANGHLQAVGTDAAGRRQYLYHPQWRLQRDAEKFDRVLELGRVMPRVRKRIDRDLAVDGMPASRATALAVRLLDRGYFRIGSDAYADEHGSIGLTTLEREHVRRQGKELVFAFIGKSGVEHDVRLDDPSCLEAIADLRRRRGGFAQLLAVKEGRRWRRLTPEEVNAYIREISGLESTAKDFRTWHATVLAAAALADGEMPSSRTALRRRRNEAIAEVAGYLGNTPAIARKSYVDPRVLDLYDEGRTIDVAGASLPADQGVVERAVLRLLEG